MTYTSTLFRGLQEVRYGATAQVIHHRAEAEGLVVTVSGTPTYEVFRNGGDTAIASGNATNTSNVLTASIDMSDTAVFPRDRHYRCRFSYTDGTTPRVRDEWFDVVDLPTDDAPPITVDDLRALHASVDGILTQLSQGTDAAARYIKPAWWWVRNKLEALGFQPSTVLPATLVELTLKDAGIRCFEAFSQSPDDLYMQMAARWRADKDAVLADLVAMVKVGDGVGVEKRRGVSQPQLLTGPDFGVSSAMWPRVARSS